MKKLENREWRIKENDEGCITAITSPKDPHGMNWAEGTKPWGSWILPAGLSAKADRWLSADGEFYERYVIRNTSKFPVFTQPWEAGVYLTFNDSYAGACECLKRRCHTHIFAGGSAAWVMAVRMNGEAPNLGMSLQKGNIQGYSVERVLSSDSLSNDRGDFIFHPDLPVLDAGESWELVLRYFWFKDRKVFFDRLTAEPDFPVAVARQCTAAQGERISFSVMMRQSHENLFFMAEKDFVMSMEYQKDTGISIWHCSAVYDRTGEHTVTIKGKETDTFLKFYVSLPAAELAGRRCRFIAERQQYFGPLEHLFGAYLIYDNETGRQYYDHFLHDHNAGRERVGMGCLVALYLQSHSDSALKKSLLDFRDFVYRELFDEKTGNVFNDIGRNAEWDRLYNYPWVSVFLMEMGKLTGEKKYLTDAVHALEAYYKKGGGKFYAIGIPMTELSGLLEKAGLLKERAAILPWFRRHADRILENSLDYPESEVSYEQSIVAPAVEYLLEAWVLFGEEKYLTEAGKQMKVLRLFNGPQPDYHQFENAIRHWDGYWFGKRRLPGDTYPHYWSVLTGMAELLYARITGDPDYREYGTASLRGCLSLFGEDGSASCAMVFPQKVNGVPGNFYDPFANDQDWALYYCLKAEEQKLL